MTPHEEKAFEEKAEKYFNSHRECPTGRNFLAWVLRFQNNIAYKSKFDEAFPNSLGSQEWMDNKFCDGCGKRKSWCECKQ